ncbi:MAG: aspartate carbamoyltransferase catalytic subunit [Clostridia bacterium]|jgi:aspartate carbamoyltransferase catalytic subunit|nr:aspartate carbamoyltransferase catalytic subunit [Clostridia bacterium]
MLKRKDLLGLKECSAEEICEILDTAEEMKKLLLSDKKQSDLLAGKALVTLFYENSTRTRSSFELAAKYLGASEVNIAVANSSVQKGETLIDTGETLDAMKIDYIVIRHPMAGAPALLAKHVKASVLNGGDGMHEHPTQALLDMCTVREKSGRIKGLKVAILGDIKHSRVAMSNLYGFTKLGAEVYMYAPSTMIPKEIEKLGAHIAKSREEALEGADAVMGLRIQLERMNGGLFPSLSEYSRYYGVNDGLLKYAKKDAIVLHPGPVNRGVELTPQVIDGEKSVILEQVTNGVAVRMALLKLLAEYREKNL